ncbi:MAG: hypothetical protein ACLGPM_03515 [Acidobacteriota bacterium]
MKTLDQATAARRVYRLKIWLRVLYSLMGCMFLAIGSLFVFLTGQGTQGPPALLLWVVFFGLGGYMLAYALRVRVVLEGNRITVRGAFRERSAEDADLEGFRTVRSRNGSYTQLVLKGGAGSISIPSSLDTDDEYRAWMQAIPDLDERDRTALLEQIKQDTELGGSEAERVAALGTAKSLSYLLTGVSVLAAVAVNFGKGSLLTPAAVTLMLAPWAALSMVFRSPLLYTLFKKKSDPRAEMSYPLLIAGFGLLFHLGAIHFISIRPLLPYAILAGLVLIAACYGPASRSPNRGTLFAVFFLAAMYSYSAVAVADSSLDKSAGASYSTQVLGHHITEGRSTTYSLLVAPWGPVATPENVSVPSSVYRSTAIGDTVCPELHPGLLRAPWFRLAPCSSPVQ